MNSVLPDDEHLAELRAAVESGAYEVDALDVADAMLAHWKRFDLPDPFDESGDAGAQSTSTGTDSEASSR